MCIVHMDDGCALNGIVGTMNHQCRRRGGRNIDRRVNGLTPDAASLEETDKGGTNHSPICRGIRSNCALGSNQEPLCADCIFLHEQHFQESPELDFLQHCRAIRQYIDQGTTAPFSPYMAAFLISRTGRVLDLDERSAAFLHLGTVLGIHHNQIWSPESDFNAILFSAIKRVAYLGKAETLICQSKLAGQTRYMLLLQPNPGAGKIQTESSQNVACMVFPLGRRRIASARQLMSLFGLSAAEARLARALCHGETLEEYAGSQGVKLPTINTQLRAVFAKTQTDRQVTLVSLITGIPPLR